MSLPETCPFCGSFAELRNGEKWVGYTCITTIHAGHDARRMQSMTCAGFERTRLLASVAELKARCKRLEEAMELVAQMRQRWLEAADDGYAGAYYAFVKNKDDEWDAIMQAKEAKP